MPLYNDANWCNDEYDALYEQQKVELDPAKRRELVKQMLTIFYREAPYVVLYRNEEPVYPATCVPVEYRPETTRSASPSAFTSARSTRGRP